MMGERRIEQPALFYEFSLDGHVPQDHLLRAIDRFVDLGGVRAHLAPFYSAIGRPSIDPELMIRMLLIGYCMGVRSERRLCEEVHLNLDKWVSMIELEPRAYGTHSLRRTKVALIYKKTGNLRACQLLLGHRKLESTVRYLGIEVDDALEMSEQIDL